MNTAGFPAILVEWEDYNQYNKLREWIAEQAKHAEIVLLVNYPEFGPEEPNEIFSVVIGNSGNLPKCEFLPRALKLVSAGSNLFPAMVVLDSSQPEFVSALDALADSDVLMLVDAEHPSYWATDNV